MNYFCRKNKCMLNDSYIRCIDRWFCVFLLTFVSCYCHATHNRGGEITYKHISGYTYEITVTTITYSESAADRCELEISYGDGSTEVVSRTNGTYGYSPSGDYCMTGELLSGYDNVRVNKYIAEHTYAGVGTFIVSVEDPNRNYGVMNIPNSVAVPFYIETALVIDNFMGSDDSPQTTMYPVDKACVGQLFISNAGAYDPDGDSLSYELVSCKGAGGANIPGYSLPDASHYLIIDSLTGDFIWNAPLLQGEYNLAYRIYEWRSGHKIGYVTRDFQVIVSACSNVPPEIQIAGQNCVVAGDTLQMKIIATDADDDYMTLIVSGEIFDDDYGAVFSVDSSAAGIISGNLTWITNCNFISANLYPVYIKATEKGHNVNLSNIGHVNINVIGGSPEWIDVEALSGDVKLTWKSYYCKDITGYFVYRTSYPDNHIADYCETGIPSGLNYELVGTILNSRGGQTVTYMDKGDNSGLEPGIKYSYRLVAFWGKESSPSILSKPSEKITVMLKKDLPVITMVSIEKTDFVSGSIKVIVSPPNEIDTVEYPGPYKYILYRSISSKNEYFAIHSSSDIFNDTIVFDNEIDTHNSQYKYFAELYNETDGHEFLMGKSQVETSVYVTSASLDRKVALQWNCEVSWIIDYYKLYNSNDVLIADSVITTLYTVDSLENGINYCFYVVSYGHFTVEGYTFPIVNRSQTVCVVPDDVEPPCPVVLSIKTDCDEMENILTWTDPDHNCCDDVMGYYVYYQQQQESEFYLLDSIIGNSSDTVYVHDNKHKLAGCYYITAIDINGNVSDKSNICCVYGNECPNYILPNVFTPNGDGYNDVFTPIAYSSVKKVEMYIYNRQGRLVYNTEDPDINWDGKDMYSKKEVATGTYFYICNVYSYSYDGDFKTVFSGAINVLR